jgi:hypothetical protein
VLELGARAAWQPSLPVASLLGDGAARCVVVSSRPRPVGAKVAWVVVPEVAWTSPEPAPPPPSLAVLPFPSGAAENRLSRRRAERRRAERARSDGALWNDLFCWIDWRELAGAFVARREGGRVALERVS